MKNLLEYKGYYGSVEYSREDALLYGKVLGINSLISYEGESVAELQQDFEGAVDDYLEVCAENGQSRKKHIKAVSMYALHLSFIKSCRCIRFHKTSR